VVRRASEVACLLGQHAQTVAGSRLPDNVQMLLDLLLAALGAFAKRFGKGKIRPYDKLLAEARMAC
jgi:hypothetical protein